MKKNKGVNPPAKKGRLNRGPWLYKFPVFILALTGCFYVVFALGKTGFFTIREIKVKDNRQIEMPGLVGRNIFCADLRRQALSAMRRYPQYCSIRAYRILPDRIYVDFNERKPLALVQCERPMLVDEFGFLFSRSCSMQDGVEQGLPVIEGLGNKLRFSSGGRRQSLAQLQLALSVIKVFEAYPALGGFSIRRVEIDGAGAVADIALKEAASPAKEAVTKEDVIQVKFGSERISEKMSLLATIFGHYSGEFRTINYIDLRFREPVIKYREEKTKS